VYWSKYGDKVQFKSYEQGYIPFESSSVDVVGLDEEPPSRKIVNSCQMRLATNNGVILMAFTPLEGLSWTYDDFYKPMVLQGAATQESERCWVYDRPGERSIRIVQMGMADNPRAADEARKMEKDETMLPAEKNARLYGEYGYAEGVFFPRLAGFDLLRPSEEHAQYVLDELPRPAAWYLVTDPNHRFGSTLWMVDGDGNRIAVHEHLREAWVSHEHAAVFKTWLRKAPDARQWADYGSAGKYASNEFNREHGMKFRSVPKPEGSVSRTIKTVRGWTIPDPNHAHPVTLEMGAPRIYFYRPGLLQRFDRDGTVEDTPSDRSELIEQLAQARQTDDENAAPDTPHKTQKHSLDLFDTARYLGEVSRSVPIEDDANPPVRVRGAGSKFVDRVPTPAEVRDGRRRTTANPMALPFPSPYPDTGEAPWLPPGY
jgi:phage terminase large subunit-like protein